MRDIMHAQPIVGHRLEGRNPLAHAIHQNLAATAGNGTKARAGELPDDILQRQTKDLAKMNELARAESMDVELRKFALNVREQIQIPLQRKLWVMAALHQNLRPAQGDRFLDFFVHLIEGDDVRVQVLFRPIKGAEFAIDIADIGVVDIAIDDVSDDLVAAAFMGLGAGQTYDDISALLEELEGPEHR